MVDVFPDVEQAVQQYLKAVMGSTSLTVGVSVPEAWTTNRGEIPHLQVQHDGATVPRHKLTSRATIRVVAWSRDTAVSKSIAYQAQGHLLGHTVPTSPFSTVQPGVGVMPIRDETSRAELAWFTVLVTARSRPL